MTANVKGAHTPKNMTKLMVKKLGINLEPYEQYSNAYLATMEDFVEGPIWVMDLYEGKITHHAILEEISIPGQPRALYIYVGGLVPQRLIDMEQSWERRVKRNGRIIRQRAQVFSNKSLEPCLKWSPIEE